MRSVVVGVDAGGTRTFALCDAGSRRSTSAAHGPANPTLYGVERSAAEIARAVDDALRGARPDAIAVGAAGAGREETASALRVAIERRFPSARVWVVDDARIALRGTVADGDGIVLIAGTGSIAYAEIGGRTHRAGGHGYAFGDDGSGHAIGSAALRLLLRSFEGRFPRDAMLEDIAARLEAASAADVVRHVYDSAAPIAAVAAFAPVVIDYADRGERSAATIVQNAARDLFELVRAVWHAAAPGDRDVPLALCGGLLRGGSTLTFLLETRLASELPYASIRRDGAPAEGALRIARELLATS